jgi:hypothetical protein
MLLFPLFKLLAAQARYILQLGQERITCMGLIGGCYPTETLLHLVHVAFVLVVDHDIEEYGSINVGDP